MEHVTRAKSKTHRRRRVSTCEYGEELRQALRAAPPLSERDKRMASGFIRVRDQRSKLAVLRACLHGTKEFKTPHLAVVFSREHRKGGIEYVGFKPTALVHRPHSEPNYLAALAPCDASGPPVLLDVEHIEYIDFLA